VASSSPGKRRALRLPVRWFCREPAIGRCGRCPPSGGVVWTAGPEGVRALRRRRVGAFAGLSEDLFVDSTNVGSLFCGVCYAPKRQVRGGDLLFSQALACPAVGGMTTPK